jgi:predicted ArsR family transcriptional regulator
MARVQTTRYRILEIMKEQGDVTVAELARRLEMAPVSVRHHLDVLQGENLICAPRVRRRGTVGRPLQVYALTEAANAHFPRNHESLAMRMLDELKLVLPADQLQGMLERMADSEARQAPPAPDGASLEQRVVLTVEFLNQRGYLARYERHGDSFMLYTLNCPYSGVSEQHRELCAMDLRLISTLLGSALVPVNRLAEGGCRCAYRVALRQPTALRRRRQPWLLPSHSVPPSRYISMLWRHEGPTAITSCYYVVAY